MCETLGVSLNGYNHDEKVISQKQDPEREALQELVVEISKDSDRTYGSRRIKKALCKKGHPVSRQKASSLMKETNVTVLTKKKLKVTTDSAHSLLLFDNVLNREFAVGQADRAYVGDMTKLDMKRSKTYWPTSPCITTRSVYTRILVTSVRMNLNGSRDECQ